MAISIAKLALHSLGSGLALARWRCSVIPPEIGVMSEVDGALNSLAHVCWQCGIRLRIDQVWDGSAAAQWLSWFESRRFFSQFASSPFQLTTRVVVHLFSWAVPQHHRHGQSHHEGTAQWLTDILGSVAEFGANLRNLPLLEGLSFG